MSEIKEIKHIGTIKDNNNYSIEVKLIEVSNGQERYDIRKYINGEHGYQGISLEEDAAKELFLVLGKEFGYLPDDATVEKQEQLKSKVKAEFFLSPEQISNISISNTSITPKEFIKNINDSIDRKHMKVFSLTKLSNWLVKQGYLREEKRPATINRTVRLLSERSSEVGITQKVVIDTATGEVLQNDIALSTEAQRFILDHLVEISSEE